jgi:hypothetical protein
MIINEKLIYNIFNLKKKIKNKIELSKYQELIPMYDIYSNQIFPIKKKNIHYRLIECHYRFINNEIYQWIKNLYKKSKKNTKLNEILKNNLKIIKNYDIKILIETSYKTLYEYSPLLGLSVSICKRNSFHRFMEHLKPYYTKIELIKLGQNMDLVKEDLDPEFLLKEDIHYDICKKVSKNDVSFEEIQIHSDFIIKSDIISWVTFYSFYGSFLFNKHLRNNIQINSFLNEGLIKIVKAINSSPKLNNEYEMYRFIQDDSFIKNMKVNDYFVDLGFLSTTRDPFYSPLLNGTFGLILVKINIPANHTGLGLFIENFSLFKKEEEFLFPPNSKLQLISKNDNFKYYHTNPIFEKIIHSKYEFNLIIEKIKICNLKIKNNIKIFNNIKEYESMATDRFSIIKNFIENYNQIQVNLNNKSYLLNALWFDSTEQSSYTNLYFNKMNDGIIFSIYENGYPYLNIEIGKEMIINYTNQFYYYKDSKKELDNELLDLILEFGRIFCYKEAKIFHNYRNFINFKNNEIPELFYYSNFYNETIYNFIKTKKKFLDKPFIKYNIGWYNLEELLNKQISSNIIDKYKLNNNIFKDALIDIIENNFILYNKFINDINDDTNFININSKKIDILKENYLIFEIYEKLNYENRINNFRSNIIFEDENKLGDDFKLIFRQPIRRF